MALVKRKALVEGIVEALESKGMIDDPAMCMLYTPATDLEGYELKRFPVFPFGITYERLYERVLELMEIK